MKKMITKLARLSELGSRPRAWRALGLVVGLTSLAASSPALADSMFGQSYFGGSATLFDARTEGRGGAGLAYRDTLNALITSPTQLPDLERVTLSLSNEFTRRDSEDRAGSVTQYDMVSPTLGIALPLWGPLSFGSGFRARRSTQWTVVRPAEADDTGDIIETLEREGTLFDIPLELGVELHPKLRLGLGLLVVRGTVRQRYGADIPGNVTDPSDVREDIYRAEAVKFALGLYDMGPISVAGFYVPRHDADVEVRIQGVSRDSARDFERVDSLPARMGVGGRFELSDRWSAGADYLREYWTDYTGRSSYAGALADEWEFHVGVEREERGEGRRRQSPVRAGGYYREWNYSLEGEPITEWGLTLGTAVPLRGAGTHADISAGLSFIGSLDTVGAKETVFRLTFSVTGSERWY